MSLYLKSITWYEVKYLIWFSKERGDDIDMVKQEMIDYSPWCLIYYKERKETNA